MSNIDTYNEIMTPSIAINNYPITEEIKKRVNKYRNEIIDIFNFKTYKYLLILKIDLGKINEIIDLCNEIIEINNSNLLIMLYFDFYQNKLLINPLDEDDNNINLGLSLIRKLFTEIALKIPIVLKYNDTILPQYFSDLVSLVITNNYQLASGLSQPVLIEKTNISTTIEYTNLSMKKQSFFGMTKDGNITFIETKGNNNTYSIINMTDYNENYNKKIIINKIDIMDIENYLNKENISGFIINQFDKEMINKIKNEITKKLNKYNKNIFEKIFDNYL